MNRCQMFQKITAMFFAVACGAAQIQAGIAEEADRLVRPLVESKTVVGLVVGIERDGKKYFAAFGELEKNSGRVPDQKTVYEMGSITKTFTGLLLADAVGRGEIALDDTIEKLLPAAVKFQDPALRALQVQMLATHTSGLPRMPDNFAPADPLNPYMDYSAGRMLAFLRGHKMRRGPGTYEYSNLAMGLLGHLLEVKSGKTYSQLVQERVAGPLGLKDTLIALGDDQKQRLALPYNAALNAESNWDFTALAGAGAIRSTAADLLKYATAYFDEKTPLHAAMKLSMQERFRNEQGIGVGLGWHIARDRQTRLHSGMTGGYSSFVAVVPEHRTAVVVLSNTASDTIPATGEKIVQAVFGMKVEPVAVKKEVEVPADVLKKYAGSYPLAPNFILTVTVEDGHLHVQATGQQKLRVYASSPTEFFYKEVEARITFVPGAGGVPEKLILHQNGRDMPAVRAK